jgi:hypothetical protein
MVRLLGLVFGVVGVLAGFALVFGAPKFLGLPYAAWAVLGGLVVVVLFFVYIMFWTIVYAERLRKKKRGSLGGARWDLGIQKFYAHGNKKLM